jgi:DNA-binding PadR family transcriptional regulator
VHLKKLAARGLIDVDKKFVDNNPLTTLRLTKEGRTAIRAYWRQIEKTRAALKSF